MEKFRSELVVNEPVEELFKWHERPEALKRLNPTFQPVHVINKEGDLRDGEVTLRIGNKPLQLDWISRHHSYSQNRNFSDEQLKGPFAFWNHDHVFESVDSENSRLVDSVTYELPFKPLGRIFAGKHIQKTLKQLFAYRHNICENDLKLYKRSEVDRGKILVTGSSGLVGTQLIPLLTGAGYEVEGLKRNNSSLQEPCWDIDGGQIKNVDRYDAVIHLAGENISSPVRWTDRKKRSILKSRVSGTKLLATHLASLENPPHTLVCASGMGIYGSRGDVELTEDEAKSDDFIAEVVKEWEAAAQPAIDAGIRVVFLRFGVILTPLGGALKRMIPATKLFAGGPIGGGQQWWSWLSIDDAIGSIFHALNQKNLSGPVNVAAPNPVRQGDFAKILGKVLNRTSFARLPGWLVSSIMGEMGRSLLLSSTKVDVSKLISSGYQFRFEKLEDSLQHLLGRRIFSD